MSDIHTSSACLQSIAADYAVELSDAQALQIVRYIELVLAANEKVNLTRIDSIDDALVLHALDSILYIPQLASCIEMSASVRFLDLGTGGGFPGIPFAVATSSNGLLIDSIHKKIDVVHSLIEQIGLQQQVDCECIRSEELALRQPNQFQIVLARAVAELAVLIEYASPLLCNSGCLVALKSAISSDEYEHACITSQICGMKLVSRETFCLPNGHGMRECYIYRKECEPSIRLPRAVGKARKRPLYIGK